MSIQDPRKQRVESDSSAPRDSATRTHRRNARHREPETESDRTASPPGWSTEFHLRRWKNGDEGGFNQLYEHFAPGIAMRVERHRLWPFLRTRHEVTDLVQAIWERVVRDAPEAFTPHGPGSFLAFLKTVLENTLIDQNRRNTARKRGDGVQPEDLDEVTLGRLEPSQPLAPETPTSCARNGELNDWIERVLSERELAVWELVERQDYSHEEAGFALDCSTDAARGVYHRARKRLIRELHGFEDDDEQDDPEQAPIRPRP